MSAVLALTLYVSMNLVLIASLALFLGLRKLAALVRLRGRHRQLIFVAQLLIFLSLASPVAIHRIPQNQMPALEWQFFQPAFEGRSVHGRLQVAKKTAPLVALPQERAVFS